MGAALASTFGRNCRSIRPHLFNEPNPIVVSRELLYREVFQPARSLNLLAASWIQFQVHDWVSHARHPLGHRDVGVPLPPGVSGWSNTPGGPPEPEMRIAGNVSVGGTLPDGSELPLFRNQVSHWWDGSELRHERGGREKLRDGAKLRLSEAATFPGVREPR